MDDHNFGKDIVVGGAPQESAGSSVVVLTANKNQGGLVSIVKES